MLDNCPLLDAARRALPAAPPQGESTLVARRHRGDNLGPGGAGCTVCDDEWTLINIFPFFNRNMYKGKEGRTGSEGRDKDPSRPVRGWNPFCCVV